MDSATQVRNGTCCRKAIRTTKLCIDAFKLGAATRFCVSVLTDVANELRENGALDEEERSIDATFVMAEGWRVGKSDQRSAEKA